jgi:hypothetical protein
MTDLIMVRIVILRVGCAFRILQKLRIVISKNPVVFDKPGF